MNLSNLLEEKKIANGLPSLAYTDSEFWQMECETVLANNWTFVGFAHELKKCGDVLPISVAEKPILLVKNTDGNIVAFHNVCKHRCLKLVDQPKNVGKLISCPYHAWAFDLDGKLRASPFFGGTDKDQQPPDFNADDHCLEPVRIKVWHDWIFVNLNNNALSFEEYAAPLIKRFKNVNFEKIYPAGTIEFDKISTNWKFLIENYIEPYHVPFVHSKTTKQPLSDHYTIVDGRCLGSGVNLSEENTAEDKLSVSSKYLSLFPNFIIGTYCLDQRYLGVHLNQALGPNCSYQKRVIYASEGHELTKDEVEFHKKLWTQVHKEDHAICEWLQQGRASPVAKKGGVLSPHWENHVREFQKLVIESVIEYSKVQKEKIQV